MLVNDTLRQNAEMHAKIPPVYEKNSPPDSLPISTEGGFRLGDKVVISNPDDHYHEAIGVCGVPMSDRTIMVNIGGRDFRFCVAALRAA